MKKINILIFALVVIIATLAISMYLRQKQVPEEPVISTQQAPLEKPEKQAIVHYPVPTPVLPDEQVSEALSQADQAASEKTEKATVTRPSTDSGNKSIEETIADFNLEEKLMQLVVTENFVQRLVAAIDNLPDKQLPRAHSPLLPPKGRFITAGTDDEPQTSRQNRSRYDVHIALLKSLDQELVLNTYIQQYQVFQNAYEQLGYQNAYFNDRLVNVIDHLLETPSPAEPIALAQPEILYIYADPLLEKLSAGQKILLRIGPEHRDTVKKILKSYRQRLIDLQP